MATGFFRYTHAGEIVDSVAGRSGNLYNPRAINWFFLRFYRPIYPLSRIKAKNRKIRQIWLNSVIILLSFHLSFIQTWKIFVSSVDSKVVRQNVG
jgi:hypothetical protein